MIVPVSRNSSTLLTDESDRRTEYAPDHHSIDSAERRPAGVKMVPADTNTTTRLEGNSDTVLFNIFKAHSIPSRLGLFEHKVSFEVST